MQHVSLREFEHADLLLLERWLQSSHVNSWHHTPQSALDYATEPPPRCGHAIVVREGHAIGYTRWQQVTRAELDRLGLTDIPDGSMDVDVIIGEPGAVGFGYAAAALELLCQRFARRGDVPMVGMAVDLESAPAAGAVAKAGFHRDRVYSPQGHGPCVLMLRDLRGT